MRKKPSKKEITNINFDLYKILEEQHNQVFENLSQNTLLPYIVESKFMSSNDYDVFKENYIEMICQYLGPNICQQFEKYFGGKEYFYNQLLIKLDTRIKKLILK